MLCFEPIRQDVLRLVRSLLALECFLLLTWFLTLFHLTAIDGMKEGGFGRPSSSPLESGREPSGSLLQIRCSKRLQQIQRNADETLLELLSRRSRSSTWFKLLVSRLSTVSLPSSNSEEKAMEDTRDATPCGKEFRFEKAES